MDRSFSSSTLSSIGVRFWENFSDARRKAPKSECIHRVGPAAREDVASLGSTADIGTLDSDVDDEPSDTYLKADPSTKRAAGSKALIIYFSKLAKKSSSETIDYRFLDSLFKSGAKVNACDKHGQTALYEVARNWNVDVAKFFLRYGAALNHTDKMGRTPLHLAAAVNHYEMVEFLIKNGGDINARTYGEGQAPIHFAAKYNAVGSLKVIIENKGNINARDYKKRTPIFLAAEMAQEDSARYLIDYGAPVGVFDDTGMSAIGCMVEKMPHIALEALDQFRTTDAAFRKDYYYLNYLDYDPAKWRHDTIMTDEFGVALVRDKKEKKKRKKEKRLACPTTALHLAVQNQDVEIIMHSVIQQLIKQKWKVFGQFGAIGSVAVHFIYIMIWTWLAIFLPPHGKYYEDGIGWRVFFEVLGVLLTFYFILKLIWENKIILKENEQYRTWRTRQINRDLEYCHPRWAQEKIFLQSEMKAIRARGGGILSDPWNILEFLNYIAVLVVIISRLAYVFIQNENTDTIHRKTYTLFLILMWLHFMKSCRPFTTLGPFITMLGHVIMDTGKFAFLFFEFFIPYTVGFWILFGGHIHARTMEDAGEDSIDWDKFNDLAFSVWQVTLNVEHNIDGLFAVNRVMAQIMVGTFFMFATVLCLNLYIALLSETFNQVYQNAKANASLLQATTILQMEKALSKSRLKKAMEYIQIECGPLELPQEEDEAGFTEKELWDRTIRTVLSKFTKLNDFLREKFDLVNPKSNKVSDQNELLRQKYRAENETFQLYQILLARDKDLHQLLLDIYDMKCMILNYLGERHNIPPKPLYRALPLVNIRPPQRTVPQIRVHPTNNSQSDNSLFRNIMNRKIMQPPKEFSTPIKRAGNPLSESWEDLSSYGEQYTDATELS